MLPDKMGIFRSPNAAIMAVNCTGDVKSSLVTETHLTEIVIVVVCSRENVSSKVIAPWQIILLQFISFEF
jgi:hypothetical protein